MQQWNIITKNIQLWCDDRTGLTKKQIKRLDSAKVIHWAGNCKPWYRPKASPSLKYWVRYIPKKANIKEWEDAMYLQHWDGEDERISFQLDSVARTRH